MRVAVHPVLLALCLGCASDPGGAAVALGSLSPADAESFVLLELFTSQSCYSCPKADANLNANARAYANSGERVFPIAWHVTTWNGLGWVDPYSDERYSERQFDYVDALDTHRYTPQLVAQGQEDFNGQNASRINEVKQRWIAEPSQLSLELVASAPSQGQVAVQIATSAVPDGADLQLVLLQSGIVDEIPSGENAGETLEHENVVRSWVTVAAGATQATLPLPADVDPAQASVLGFVQDRTTMAVLAAEPAALP